MYTGLPSARANTLGCTLPFRFAAPPNTLACSNSAAALHMRRSSHVRADLLLMSLSSCPRIEICSGPQAETGRDALGTPRHFFSFCQGETGSYHFFGVRP